MARLAHFRSRHLSSDTPQVAHQAGVALEEAEAGASRLGEEHEEDFHREEEHPGEEGVSGAAVVLGGAEAALEQGLAGGGSLCALCLPMNSFYPFLLRLARCCIHVAHGSFPQGAAQRNSQRHFHRTPPKAAAA